MDNISLHAKKPDPSVIVVYNPMSAACVLAAAMIASSQPTTETFKITESLPYTDDYENKLRDTTVYWLGVDPENIVGAHMGPKSYYLYDENGPCVYRENSPNTSIIGRRKNNPVFLSSEELEMYYPDGHLPTIVDKLQFLPGTEFPVPTTWFATMGHLVQAFQDPENPRVAKRDRAMSPDEIQQSLRGINPDILLVYYNLGLAQSCLDAEKPWTPATEVPRGFEAQYLEDLQIVKKKLNKNLKRVPVQSGDRVVSAATTSFHDFLVHLGLRMVRMSDGAFVNFTHSTSHPIIYTNVKGLVLDQVKYHHIKLELS